MTLVLYDLSALSLLLLLALFLPTLGDRQFSSIVTWSQKLARHKVASVFVVGAVPFVLKTVLHWFIPVRVPSIPDEFSHLLIADTFASGRITNPPHPMWIHLETIHINFLPTYSSMYPVGNGAIMGAAQAIFGHPIWGVWLSVAAMSAGICWMLQGWMPAKWAFLGAVLSVAIIAPTYWADAYYGGALAATGGALVLGALPRLMRRLKVSNSIALAIGFAVLANTRPYEGGVLCLTVSLVLLFVFLGTRPRGFAKQFLLPVALIGSVSVLAMLYYFWRLTGNPLLMPYDVNSARYWVSGPFVWSHLRPEPIYHNPQMKEFYTGWTMDFYRISHSARGEVKKFFGNFYQNWDFYLVPVLTLPLIWGLFTWSSKKVRLLILLFSVTFFAAFLEIWYASSHYIAPVMGALIGIVVIGLRRISKIEFKRMPAGLTLTRLIVTTVILFSCWKLLTRRQLSAPFAIKRAAIEHQLESMPGKDVVLVHYAPGYKVADAYEWVYNRADIDASPVVWARDLGDAQNEELRQYYKDRKFWLLDVSNTGIQLSPASQSR